MQLEDLECTSNAVRVQLDCYMNIARNVTHVQFHKFVCWIAQESNQNVLNAVGMPQEYLESSWKTLQMPFDTFPLGMQLKSFSMSKIFQLPKRMGTNIWNSVGSFRMHSLILTFT